MWLHAHTQVVMDKTCLRLHKTYAGVRICIAMSVAIPPPLPYYRYILANLTRVSAFYILPPSAILVRIPRTLAAVATDSGVARRRI